MPGAGIKFFIDGRASANAIVGQNFEIPAGAGNYFGSDLSNHQAKEDRSPDTVPQAPSTPRDFLLQFKIIMPFQQHHNKTINQEAEAFLGISNLALYHVDGAVVPEEDVEYPYQLILKPNETLKQKFRDMSPTADLMETYSQVPAGSILYHVYAKASPESDAEKIGELKTKSEFFDSSFSDTKLRFAHQLKEDDLVRHPEWADAILPKSGDPSSIFSLSTSGCPYLRGRATEFKKQLLAAGV